MNININNKFVMICGPTTTGKTTLAYRIKNEFSGNCVIISQDEVINEFPHDENGIRDAAVIDAYHASLLCRIGNALNNPDVDLVVFETLSLEARNVFSILLALPFLNYHGPVTLLKMALPYGLHCSFCRERKRLRNEQPEMHAFTRQIATYNSSYGTLKTNFPNCDEIVINDPTKLTMDIRPTGSKRF